MNPTFGSSGVERSRLRQLDQMRRHRNRSEYGVRSFSAQETEGAIDLAMDHRVRRCAVCLTPGI